MTWLKFVHVSQWLWSGLWERDVTLCDRSQIPSVSLAILIGSVHSLAIPEGLHSGEEPSGTESLAFLNASSRALSNG